MAQEFFVMRHEKYNRKDNIRALQAEANREWEDTSWYRDNVDLNLSHLNISLVHTEHLESDIYHECYKNKCSIQDDSVLLIGTVYTASAEFFERCKDKDGNFTKDGIETIKAYFTECLDFHKSLYGIVLSAEIHLDQKTPHLHVYSCPIIAVNDVKNVYIEAESVKVWDKKTKSETTRLIPKKDENGNLIKIENPSGKLADLKKILKETPHLQRKEKTNKYHVGLNGNKALGGKSQMSQHQTMFFDEVGKKYGLSRGECRIGLEPKVHVSCAEHNMQEAMTKKHKLDKEVKATEDKVTIAEVKQELAEDMLQQIQIELQEQMMLRQDVLEKELEAKYEEMAEELEREFNAKNERLQQEFTEKMQALDKRAESFENMLNVMDIETSDLYATDIESNAISTSDYMTMYIDEAKKKINRNGESLHDVITKSVNKQIADKVEAQNKVVNRIHGTKTKVKNARAGISSEIDYKHDDMSK